MLPLTEACPTEVYPLFGSTQSASTTKDGEAITKITSIHRYTVQYQRQKKSQEKFDCQKWQHIGEHSPRNSRGRREHTTPIIGRISSLTSWRFISKYQVQTFLPAIQRVSYRMDASETSAHANATTAIQQRLVMWQRKLVQLSNNDSGHSVTTSDKCQLQVG